MYKKIAVPVDLAHSGGLEKALVTAADLGKLYAAEIYIVAVTSSAPSEVAHNPDEFREKLAAFAQHWSERQGTTFVPKMLIAADPGAELDRVLNRNFHDLGIDLVVMASHVPGFKDYIFASRAGFLASHSDLSVLVVR